MSLEHAAAVLEQGNASPRYRMETDALQTRIVHAAA